VKGILRRGPIPSSYGDLPIMDGETIIKAVQAELR